mgnify:CR=1 FL=1
MEHIFYRASIIYLVGILGIWKAIPVGIMLKAHPLETAILTSLGSITTVYFLYYIGEKAKYWVMKKWSKEKLEQTTARFSRISHKYGVAGLGLICPGLFGPITTILVGLIIIPNTSRLMPFLVAGIVLWSLGLTYLAESGISLAQYLISK